MKHILMIATGGTIASRSTDSGLTPLLSSEDLLRYIPRVSEFCTVTTVQPFNLDSTISPLRTGWSLPASSGTATAGTTGLSSATARTPWPILRRRSPI